MTFDLSTSVMMRHYHNGNHYDYVMRDTHSLTAPFSQSDTQWVNFRAQYASSNFVLIQSLSFNRNADHNIHQQSGDATFS